MTPEEFRQAGHELIDWHVLAPVQLQTVCIRHQPAVLEGEALDQHTLNWVNRINASGVAFMSPSKLGDGWMVRVSIGVESTTRTHIEKLWHSIQNQVANNE